MAIRCSKCKKEFDVTLFEFESIVTCVCGNIVTLQHEEIFRDTFLAHKEEEKRIVEIKKLADRITFLIVSTDYPKIDIEIEKQKFREKINELLPDKVYLYDLIYESRFKRLEEQFRDK